MKMNTSLARITFLAVIFAPMAFVSSFFSMTPELGALKQTFWIYFAIAVPVTVLCMAVADPGRVWDSFMWLRRRVGARRRMESVRENMFGIYRSNTR